MRQLGPTTLGAYHGDVWIDERLRLPATLRIEQDRIDISTAGPKPDPDWSVVDSNGHFHAMSGKEYPTLRAESVHVECDGSCGGVCEGDGYYITRYRCSLCDEVVEPGMIPGPHFDSAPGMRSWKVQAEGYVTDFPAAFDRVSLRFEAQTPRRVTFFGTASAYNHSLSSGIGNHMHLSVSFTGVGALGETSVPTPDPARASTEGKEAA